MPTPRRCGGGDDRFQWDPGDGSDIVDGEGGSDVLAFNGSNIGEEIGAVGERLARAASRATSRRSRWTSTAIEGVDVRALGGADTITVNDLRGTDLKRAPTST